MAQGFKWLSESESAALTSSLFPHSVMLALQKSETKWDRYYKDHRHYTGKPSINGTSRFMVGDGSKVKAKLFAQSVLLAITVYLPFFLLSYSWKNGKLYLIYSIRRHFLMVRSIRLVYLLEVFMAQSLSVFKERLDTFMGKAFCRSLPVS